MPCRDYYDDHPEAYYKDVTIPALKEQVAFAESALCAALNALDNIPIPEGAKGKPNALERINYKEAGITKQQLAEWRKNHQELDKKHRELEQEKLKASALAKLTPAEKEALGYK